MSEYNQENLTAIKSALAALTQERTFPADISYARKILSDAIVREDKKRQEVQCSIGDAIANGLIKTAARLSNGNVQDIIHAIDTAATQAVRQERGELHTPLQLRPWHERSAGDGS